MFYAQLDNNGICYGVSNLSRIVEDNNLVLLNNNDLTVIGKKYNNGLWEDVSWQQPEPEPTQLDRIESGVNNLNTSQSALDVLLGVDE